MITRRSRRTGFGADPTAIFIADDVAFLGRLPNVDRIAIDAVLADRGPLTIEFEVGGYDPARFASPPSG